MLRKEVLRIMIGSNFVIPEDYRIEHVDLPVPVLRNAISPDSVDEQGNVKPSNKRIRKESALRLLVVSYFLARQKDDQDLAGYVDSVTLSRLQKLCRVKSKATVISALNHLQDLGYLTWNFDRPGRNVFDIVSERTVSIKLGFFGQMYKKDYGGYRKLPSPWMGAFLDCDTPSDMRTLIYASINSFCSDDKHSNCSVEERVPALRKTIFRTSRRRDLIRSMDKLKNVIHYATRNELISFRLDNQYSFSHLMAATKKEIIKELKVFQEDYDKAVFGDVIDWNKNKYHSILAEIRSLPWKMGGLGNSARNGSRDYTGTWDIFDEESCEEISNMSIHYGFERVINGIIKFIRTYAPKASNGSFLYKDRKEFFKILNKIVCSPET